MTAQPNCPECNSEYVYEDGSLLICPECAYEWDKNSANTENDNMKIIKDANGSALQDGDTITVIKDLKVKGSSLVVSNRHLIPICF